MSNGVAYVLDETHTFEGRVNPDMVDVTSLDAEDGELLQRLMHEHEEKTVSPRARTILVQWSDYLPLFKKVSPKGAFGLVAAAREAYLQTPLDHDRELARRSA